MPASAFCQFIFARTFKFRGIASGLHSQPLIVLKDIFQSKLNNSRIAR